MTDQPGDPGPPDHTDAEPTPERSGGVARWQKVVAIIGLAVLLAVIILVLGGDHSPRRHGPAESPGQTDVDNSSGHDPSQFQHGD